ncbi:histidine kinase [Rhodobacterales bacterium HKCCE2091]|nr:histidine kinase [Rhodobacterales bacterium HKCCE2091]
MGGENAAAKDDGPIPVVAIGASAGGLEPLERFFSEAPPESGWCFIVFQHLSPDYRSMMDELLGRRSRMTIRHIDDEAEIAPNTIFLNRPGRSVVLRDDKFHVTDFGQDDTLPRQPIDKLFASLADRDPNRTAAIVLSGSGTDGSHGARTFHLSGGMVMVQSLEEAAFSSMPRATVDAGAADRVLFVSDMLPELQRLFSGELSSERPDTEEEEVAIARILKLLERTNHVDFSAYRQVSIGRRVIRRQQLLGLKSISDYARLLAASPQAMEELFQDLLIGVTAFYRDTEAITALRRKVLDPMARGENQETPIRIWVPACATGEEAYTIAMEMSEALEEAGSNRRFRVIATDIHRQSLDIASAGTYSEEAVARVPDQLRNRYFLRQRDLFVVNPLLRQKLIFSAHDVLSDPPFMHLDLISCRNLFIYLNEEAQARIISLFLFGLRKEGYLFLGQSESLGKFSSEFQEVDARMRLFQKSTSNSLPERTIVTEARRRMTPHFGPRTPPQRPARAPAQITEVAELRSRDTLIRSYDALLKRYAPPSILVSMTGAVLSWFGAASRFIDTMNNMAEWRVEDIVHPDLHFTINVGMEKLRQGNLEPYMRQVDVEMGDGVTESVVVKLEALDEVLRTRIMMISFLGTGAAEGDAPHADTILPGDTAVPITAVPATTEDITQMSNRIQQLERDLRLTEETLQHATERLEASGEELQASNEELQASNEELQASNEELQSSNEELHAVNEELVSVSAEHERKIELLSVLNHNTDMVLRLLGVGVIFVDGNGRIRRFSELIGTEFLMQTHDADRPLSVVGPRFDFVDLPKLVDGVLTSSEPADARGDWNGRDLSIEVHPITTETEVLAEGGAVIVIHGLAETGNGAEAENGPD